MCLFSVFIHSCMTVPKSVHENRTKGVENKVDDTLKLVVFLECAQCQERFLKQKIKTCVLLQIFADKGHKKAACCTSDITTWLRTHVTFPVIPKRCCHFSVVQNFQFEITTHLMANIRDQLIENTTIVSVDDNTIVSVDVDVCHQMCCNLELKILSVQNDVFRVQISDCYSMCLRFVCKQSDENHSVNMMID